MGKNNSCLLLLQRLFFSLPIDPFEITTIFFYDIIPLKSRRLLFVMRRHSGHQFKVKYFFPLQCVTLLSMTHALMLQVQLKGTQRSVKPTMGQLDAELKVSSVKYEAAYRHKCVDCLGFISGAVIRVFLCVVSLL